MAVSVSIVRMTPRVDEIAEFYQLIGLRMAISGERMREMVCDAGSILVHGGEGEARNELFFTCPDVHTEAETLRDKGFEVDVWDEAYGKQASILSPLGAAVWINNELHEAYGFTAHAHEPGPHRVELCAIYVSEDFDRDREFFNRLGFSTIGETFPGVWEQLSGPADAGHIGMHGGQEQPRVETSDDPITRVKAQAGVSLQTSEPLEELAARLSEAGFPAEVVVVPHASKVHVVDPDGFPLEIHPLAH